MNFCTIYIVTVSPAGCGKHETMMEKQFKSCNTHKWPLSVSIIPSPTTHQRGSI